MEAAETVDAAPKGSRGRAEIQSAGGSPVGAGAQGRTGEKLTDIDCAYCRQLADEMPQLVQAGVEVRYLAFPRTGVDSPSWDKAVSVWCARDRRIAYQLAMKGNPVAAPDASCDSRPVLAGYEFAHKLGLDGTPVIFTEDGHLIDGYVPADQLVKLLDNPSLLAAASN